MELFFIFLEDDFSFQTGGAFHFHVWACLCDVSTSFGWTLLFTWRVPQ